MLVLVAAIKNAWNIIDAQAHGLLFIKLRVSERRQPFYGIERGLRKAMLVHIDEIGDHQPCLSGEVRLGKAFSLPSARPRFLFGCFHKLAHIPIGTQLGQTFGQLLRGNLWQGGKECPLIWVWLKAFVYEQRVAVLLRLPLKRDGDQVSKAAVGHGVLRGKQTVIRGKGNLVPARHRPGQQSAAQLTRVRSGNRRSEEKPDVGAVAGAGALHGRRQSVFTAGLPERGNIRLPASLVKIRRQQPCHVVFQHGIDSCYISTIRVAAQQMGSYNLRSQWLERAVWAFGTLVRLFIAHAFYPLVFTDRRIAAFPRVGAIIALGVKAVPAAKHGDKTVDLLLRGAVCVGRGKRFCHDRGRIAPPHFFGACIFCSRAVSAKYDRSIVGYSRNCLHKEIRFPLDDGLFIHTLIAFLFFSILVNARHDHIL